MTSMKLTGALYRPGRSVPMVRAENELDLAGIARKRSLQNVNARDPRQICIVHEDELKAQEINSEQSRVNLVISGGSSAMLRSGALVEIGRARIRITFKCEPCKHGAQIADVPMTRFRNLKRYLGLVVDDESIVTVGSAVTIYPDMFDVWEDDFRGRVTHALRLVPEGERVLSTELLFAIGAGKVYARALPRWVQFAEILGVRPGIVKYTGELSPKDANRTYPLGSHLWGGRL
ncbi:MOSC domain-containing protein [Arthrobacter sp. HLT1-20]